MKQRYIEFYIPTLPVFAHISYNLLILAEAGGIREHYPGGPLQ